MLNFLPESILPWLLGGLVLLALFALSATIKSWRESKRSPYYFLRMQAGRRMQRYLVMSFALVLLAAAASAYAWQVPEESAELVGVLKHAKPNPEILDQVNEPESPTDEGPGAVTVNLAPASDRDIVFSAAELINSAEASAAEEIQSTADVSTDEISTAETRLAKDAQLGDIAFSLDISGNYRPVDPTYQFVEGFFTLYATFSYQGMADGMNWSWSWQRNGAQLDGGNQVWSYGGEGPGYIYFRPEDGFHSGEYSLAIWVDQVLQSQASFTVAEGIAASN